MIFILTRNGFLSSRAVAAAAFLAAFQPICIQAQQCPVTVPPAPPVSHIVIEMNEDHPSQPLRQQVLEPNSTIVWHQDPANLGTPNYSKYAAIKIEKKTTGLSPLLAIQPCIDPSAPDAGSCTVATDIVDATHPTEIFEYKYCSSNESALPGACPADADVKTHTIRIRYAGSDQIDAGFRIGNVDLILPLNTGEVDHIIFDTPTCVHWRNWLNASQEVSTFITFDPSRPAIKNHCFPSGSTTGVESCSIPKRPSGTHYLKANYKLCSIGPCDPTIHILGSGDTYSFVDPFNHHKHKTIIIKPPFARRSPRQIPIEMHKSDPK